MSFDGWTPKSVLCVVAHPDDLELMAGGTVVRWVEQGVCVHALTMTNGAWTSPGSQVMREADAALTEERNAARRLGITVENLGEPAMDLKFEDRLVVEVLRRIETRKVDTLICTWDGDLHHDHEVVSRIAVAASRRVPRVLMGQINHYLRNIFTPNVFVDITDTWEQKIAALECYTTQWERAGKDWHAFMDETTRYYGRLVGVERAEGFMSQKFLL
jgi:LmbE family N-acetylglucosaminyl deacetylase